ncbi:Root UVB sensitive family [Heracleum sosnowskyi]|uniref:Root UVB sensitive family n=1 Tax=Heracleum sosnowskyi TaxID=360622 RepID=A0AAD8M056_9APIA|nr:Root UVB sensitive family [Heracleum sosnowskyi]
MQDKKGETYTDNTAHYCEKVSEKVFCDKYRKTTLENPVSENQDRESLVSEIVHESATTEHMVLTSPQDSVVVGWKWDSGEDEKDMESYEDNDVDEFTVTGPMSTNVLSSRTTGEGLAHDFIVFNLKGSPKVFSNGPRRLSNFSTCNSKFDSSQGENEHVSEHSNREEKQRRVILVERYGNGSSKRYILDENSRLSTCVDVKRSKPDGVEISESSNGELSWLPDNVKDFILPAGFPGSVSADYLEYIMLQFPTNVTGWICHALVTSSLLKALGVGSFSGTTAAASAAASAAAIRWVSKDGIGAVGRLFIGGRFGSLFDDDPKQWRMYADFIGSAGSIFDLTTPLYPSNFLLLASLGNLTKAVARGLKDPSFRVIQNHFSISGNLGEVAAKEEVWEVAAQLVGLGLGILILDAPGFLTSYPVLVLTWTGMRILHLWLRYQSLSVLQFSTINLKRARILVQSHVSGSNIPGCHDCNSKEDILLWERFIKPRIRFGAPLEDMVDGEIPSSKVKMLLLLYEKEKYILVVNQKEAKEFEALVSFKEGATSLTVLRSVWQTYWLYQNLVHADNFISKLEESLNKLDSRFENFLQQLKEAGWDINLISLKVPKEILIEETHGS